MAESSLCLIVLICVIEFGAHQASLPDSDMLFAVYRTAPKCSRSLYSALCVCVCQSVPFLYIFLGDDDLGAAETGVYTHPGCVYVYVEKINRGP